MCKKAENECLTGVPGGCAQNQGACYQMMAGDQVSSVQQQQSAMPISVIPREDLDAYKPPYEAVVACGPAEKFRNNKQEK